MKKMIFLLLVILIPVHALSQNYRKLQETFLDAEYFLMYEDYADAAGYYQRLLDELPDNANIAYRLGICYLNMNGRKKEAIDLLEKATDNVSSNYREGSLKQKSAPYDVYFYLGMAYRVNYQFGKARETFNLFKNTLLPEDVENKLFIDQQIAMCDHAEMLMENPVDFTIERMEGLINDEKDNFNPIFSGDGKTMMFMTSYKFYDGVMYSTLSNGKWSPPVNITPDILSDGDLYISSLSRDGRELYMSRDDDFNSDLYYSILDGNKWQKAEKLGENINTDYWESHACISGDGQTLYFASNREGGYGGLDLYASQRLPDGNWGPAENMGPGINTPFNEDRPFVTDNGNTIHFCSQGHNSMGGFDLFYSTRLQNGQWNKPQNMGYPLNTTEDDIFFFPLHMKAGYKSMNRPEGAGKRDIYLIHIK